MNPVELNLDAAEAARDAGVGAAVAHAERVTPEWSQLALAQFIEYAKARPHEAFMVEDVRAALPDDFPPPPDNRSWGKVPLLAKALGRVHHAGFCRQKAANCHGSPKSMWRYAA